MIQVRQAVPGDAEAISRVCTAGWRDTYAALHSQEYIAHVVAKFYSQERLLAEIMHHPDWDGWQVAERDGVLLGAGGGGLTSRERWEIFVLYLDPDFRRQGAGSALVAEMTRQALRHGATEQWVSATKGNVKGLPFYEALGFSVQSERSSVFAPTGETISSLRLMRPLLETAVQP
ncbi:GNAT family N-acetyltransferase [Deinococcus radiomollis]|uniref:GNAT family N-acetyltransferase n=1 Tax=Deinococcus radiomollis TaxID=468916 RepID=UPI0038925115